jgi:hypothetical protein
MSFARHPGIASTSAAITVIEASEHGAAAQGTSGKAGALIATSDDVMMGRLKPLHNNVIASRTSSSLSHMDQLLNGTDIISGRMHWGVRYVGAVEGCLPPS